MAKVFSDVQAKMAAWISVRGPSAPGQLSRMGCEVTSCKVWPAPTTNEHVTESPGARSTEAPWQHACGRRLPGVVEPVPRRARAESRPTRRVRPSARTSSRRPCISCGGRFRRTGRSRPRSRGSTDRHQYGDHGTATPDAAAHARCARSRSRPRVTVDAGHRPPGEQLHRAIRRLGEVNRALVTCYLDDLSYKEIADVLGLSETNVGARLSRAKTKLQALVRSLE